MLRQHGASAANSMRCTVVGLDLSHAKRPGPRLTRPMNHGRRMPRSRRPQPLIQDPQAVPRGLAERLLSVAFHTSVRRHEAVWSEEADVPSIGSSCTSRQQPGGPGGGNGCRDSLLPRQRVSWETVTAEPLTSNPEPWSPPSSGFRQWPAPCGISALFCTLVTFDS